MQRDWEETPKHKPRAQASLEVTGEGGKRSQVGGGKGPALCSSPRKQTGLRPWSCSSCWSLWTWGTKEKHPGVPGAARPESGSLDLTGEGMGERQGQVGENRGRIEGQRKACTVRSVYKLCGLPCEGEASKQGPGDHFSKLQLSWLRIVFPEAN